MEHTITTHDEHDEETVEEEETNNFDEPVPGCSTAPVGRKRGSRSIYTPGLIAALDRTKMSDRNTSYVLAEAASSLGHDADELILNRTSLYKARKKIRITEAETLKREFKDGIRSNTPLGHWVGKLMGNLSGSKHVDRLPISVSGHWRRCVTALGSGRVGQWDGKGSGGCGASSHQRVGAGGQHNCVVFRHQQLQHGQG